jgi:hypothetical protein
MARNLFSVIEDLNQLRTATEVWRMIVDAIPSMPASPDLQRLRMLRRAKTFRPRALEQLGRIERRMLVWLSFSTPCRQRPSWLSEACESCGWVRRLTLRRW